MGKSKQRPYQITEDIFKSTMASIQGLIRPLLQEVYQDDAWKMLVCCILLNLTKRTQVDIIRDELFTLYPTAHKMMNANQSELSELLQPLGLHNRRARSLIKFSADYINGFNSVDQLYGIGQYAKDSWEIFQNDNRSVNPTDKVLIQYLQQTK
jgi:methyl-CpG-binding domain protein 4